MSTSETPQAFVELHQESESPRVCRGKDKAVPGSKMIFFFHFSLDANITRQHAKIQKPGIPLSKGNVTVNKNKQTNKQS